MKNKRFDWLTALISFAASAAVFAVCLVILDKNRSLGVVFNVLGTAVTVVLPVIVSALILRLFPKRAKGLKVTFPKFLTASGAILLVILFLVAGLGQLLYSLSVSTYEEHIRDDVEIRTTEHGENMDIVLLLDISGSMTSALVPGYAASYYKVSSQASELFIDRIAEECRMAGSAFADMTNLKKSGFDHLITMSPDNKKIIKENLKDTADVGGGTSIETALRDAFDILMSDSPERKKAIVLFSDGVDALIDNSIFTELENNDISVVLLRPFIENYDIDVANDDLKNYVNAHGKDIKIDFLDQMQNGNQPEDVIGKIADELSETVIKEETQEIVTPVYETRHKVEFLDVLMLYDTEPHTVLRMLIAAVCFILFAVLIQAIHFRKASVSGFVLGGIFGLVAFGLTIAGGALAAVILPAISVPLLLYTLFIKTESR